MVLADDAEALAQLVRWCREHAVARVHAHLDDDRLLRALAENGYAREENERVESGLLLPVADRHAGDVAEGYRVRPVRDDELAERVDCHRAAWRPADLPRPPGHERAGPDETSSFTRSMYEEVRDTWGYRAELDLVVEAPDGSLAGCCIAWLDERIGVAEIEPLGVVPAHRGRRLASAMCLDAARRIEARGGTTVFINAEPRAEYPAPGRAYLHAGFHTVPRFVRCRLP